LKLKKLSSSIALIGASALVLSGCAAGGSEADFKACAVSDIGVWEDNSFNEQVFDGMNRIKEELNVETLLLQSNSGDDWEPNLTTAVSEGCDVVFAVGFGISGTANAVAANNPGVNFVSIDGGSEHPNVKAVGYNMQESSYLAGYLAAAYSTTKVVGTFGGWNIPPVAIFMDGFYFGAKAYEAETGTAVTVLGWDPATQSGLFNAEGPEGFADNSPNSKANAATMIAAGADVVFPVGGNQFSAVNEAFNEAGVAGVQLGVDKDVALTSPEFASFILTSVEKRMGDATFDITKALLDGEAFNNEQYTGTLANRGTLLSPFYDFDARIPQEVKDRLAELEAGIIAGTINPLS
jgi:basic membrane protein A and related proteins